MTRSDSVMPAQVAAGSAAVNRLDRAKTRR
jgi:hypothetical protein